MAEPYPHFLPELYQEIHGCLKEAPATPSGLRRFFLLMLRGHWSDAGNHGPDLQENLRCLFWTPEKNSPVNIALQGASNEQTDPYSIFLSLGNFQFKHMSMRDEAEIEEDNATTITVMPATAQLLIKHEAPSADQAFDMAWSTLCFLVGFRPAILSALGGESAGFFPQVVGEPRREENAPKTRFRVDVGAALTLNVAVTTNLESHKLKRVALTLLPQ